MLDREYAEKLLAKSRNWQGPIAVSALSVAELCRVYLAWLDAPEARPLELQCKGIDDPDRDRLNRMIKSGKRYKLMEVVDAD